MKRLKMLLILIGICALFTLPKAVYAETIYTLDGRQIKAKITEITADTIWYETTTEGDVTEYNGIAKEEVVKILNDDGSVYQPKP